VPIKLVNRQQQTAQVDLPLGGDKPWMPAVAALEDG
jgi:hypothetical protein